MGFDPVSYAMGQKSGGGGGGGGGNLTFTQLMSEQMITGTGNKSLSDSVMNYDAILVVTSVGDKKTYLIPKSLISGNTFDVSWNATDSTEWYAVVVVSFSGSTMTVTRAGINGFGSVSLSVYGVKIS